MGLFDLKPSRKHAQDTTDVEIISDLDKMVARRIGFRWNGKVHFIAPMELETFLVTMNELQSFSKTMIKAQKGEITFRDCMKDIHRTVASVCSTISLDDLMSMTFAQVNALNALIVKTVTGEAHAEKKTQQEPIPPPSS